MFEILHLLSKCFRFVSCSKHLTGKELCKIVIIVLSNFYVPPTPLSSRDWKIKWLMVFTLISSRMFMLFFLLVLCSTQGNQGNDDAKRLYDDLINGYNSLIRPVGNNSDRLTVKMGLRLSQLIDVVSDLIRFFFWS